jgi:hypothetical protein
MKRSKSDLDQGCRLGLTDPAIFLLFVWEDPGQKLHAEAASAAIRS